MMVKPSLITIIHDNNNDNSDGILPNRLNHNCVGADVFGELRPLADHRGCDDVAALSVRPSPWAPRLSMTLRQVHPNWPLAGGDSPFPGLFRMGLFEPCEQAIASSAAA